MRLKASQTGSRQAGTDAPPRGLPYQPGIVSRDNFDDKALGFMRASGTTNGEHPVVRKPTGSEAGNIEAWVAWMAYFEIIGKPTTFVQSHGVITVPALFPWDFSADADGLHGDLSRLVDDFRHEEQRPVIGDARRHHLGALMRSGMVEPKEMRKASQVPRRARVPGASAYDAAHVPIDYEAPVALSADLVATLPPHLRPRRDQHEDAA